MATNKPKHYPPEIELCSPEVRLRLYALVNAVRESRSPDMEDIVFLAAYCEVKPAARK